MAVPDDNEPEILYGHVIKKDKNGRPMRNRGRSSLMPPHVQLALMRDIACGTGWAELGRKYGYTRQSMLQFSKRHALKIEEIREHLDDEFAGLPIAQKKNRIAAYQEMAERIHDSPNAAHHEWIKAEAIINRNVAEEMGQLPPRQSITVVPVQHVVVGVETGDLT